MTEDSTASPAPAYASDPARVGAFGRFVAANINGAGLTSPSILEIGCGDGTLLQCLKEMVPGCRCTGVDCSPSNIELARVRLQASEGPPATLIAGDYCQIPFRKHDVVVSHEVLQLLTIGDERLYAKLAREIPDRGLLAITLPYVCWRNRVLMMARRCLALVRCRLVEKAVLQVAVLVHGRSQSRAFLADRVRYTFEVSRRFYSQRVRVELRVKWNLELVAERSSP
jgi:trans-aconitate methyltransferase